MSRPFYIAVDFDGTIVEHAYPEIGLPVPGAVEALRAFHNEGAKLILWTMRSGETLEEALLYLLAHEVVVFGVNENPTQTSWTNSRKAYANLYIDDAAFGTPTKLPPPKKANLDKRPYVDWNRITEPVLEMIKEHNRGY